MVYKQSLSKSLKAPIVLFLRLRLRTAAYINFQCNNLNVLSAKIYQKMGNLHGRTKTMHMKAYLLLVQEKGRKRPDCMYLTLIHAAGAQWNVRALDWPNNRRKIHYFHSWFLAKSTHFWEVFIEFNQSSSK
jgi:hypothetical protein